VSPSQIHDAAHRLVRSITSLQQQLRATSSP
jgi:hypothetical protein